MLELIRTDVFYEVAVLLALAATVGYVGMLLRQPLIVSFIVVGIVAGPALLDIAQAHEQIDLLGKLGIALLLFLVGLKLDLQLVRSLGLVSLTTGLGQVVFTTAFGYLIGRGLGLGAVESAYVAVALTFSSTIIIVKLLSDKREIDSLHGRIALGFLIVQDFVVVLAMIVLSSIAAGEGQVSAASALLQVGASAAGTLLVVGLFIRFLATPLLRRLARVPELLVAFAMGWAALLAAAGDHLGFGKKLGGLLAGISFASTPFRDAMAARLAPLRDFLLLFFFLSLGAGLQLQALGSNVAPALVFSVRAHRQPVDRADHHGAARLSPAHRLPRRSDRGADQRILVDLRGHGGVAGPGAAGRARAGDDGGAGDHRGLDLHDHLFASVLRAVRAAAGPVRAPRHPARAP
jgi:Kef-type K+ transport system membrane component KefB